ncbi:hypothetical protein ANANG_G00076610 [Anguilla anguilla]|uniref:UDENN domain-containing protein n=1 Tax=Anguilla anguilla TaxID=7936 RepID=A0A9D3MJ72_ANGAN|nr:hypothetical protein ANANG_G00076610 [Anguilla anguilla]
MESHGKEEPKGPVLHIVVVGFHHKKGCQVEFSYPPLLLEESHDSSALPEEWKYLPFLALPDGAHNYQEDTVYFHLPPLHEGLKCVYGVSCYRQIESKALKVRLADVTRETVQKSVCVLSRVPLYGLLQAKLQLITHAYFEEKDFSQISILKELYEHMNGSLRGTALEGSQVYLGLSPRDLILHFRHNKNKKQNKTKTAEREKQPAGGNTHDRLIPFSWYDRARPGRLVPLQTQDQHVRGGGPRPGSARLRGVRLRVRHRHRQRHPGAGGRGPGGGGGAGRGEPAQKRPEDSPPGPPSAGDNHHLKPPSRTSPESSESDWETLDPSVLEEGGPGEQRAPPELPETFEPEPGLPITVQPQSSSSPTALAPGLLSGLEEDQYGLPLAIFTKGYLCLPYMALQQHHLLSDVTVRGFVAGATNILFRQQRHLSDAIVEVEEARIQIQDPELRKVLSLTTADLRFADYLLKHFGLYVHSLLSSTLQQDNEKLLADYGAPFITAWKITHNYRVWHSNKHPAMAEVTPGHPFQGQYSVADVKLRLSHSVQNSERGKKLGNAVITTSRSVVQTGKAVGQSVGGALNSAKSAMSSWFSTLAQPAAVAGPPCPEQPAAK